jgi:hypothetical protein
VLQPFTATTPPHPPAVDRRLGVRQTRFAQFTGLRQPPLPLQQHQAARNRREHSAWRSVVEAVTRWCACLRESRSFCTVGSHRQPPATTSAKRPPAFSCWHWSGSAQPPRARWAAGGWGSPGLWCACVRASETAGRFARWQ